MRGGDEEKKKGSDVLSRGDAEEHDPDTLDAFRPGAEEPLQMHVPTHMDTNTHTQTRDV